MLSYVRRIVPESVAAQGSRRRATGPLFLFFCTLVSPFAALAEIHDVTVTDVTPHAFAVVGFSDEPVLDATVRVFADESGLDEITANLSISLVSANFPEALDRGIVKVDVVGLEPDTAYFFSLETTTGSGVLTYP